MSRAIIITPDARAHIRAIDEWWRVNRGASPELFAEELSQAVATLKLAPGAGRRYAHRTLKGVRRLSLRTTRNHVYYVANDERVVIIAVWGAIKGIGPNLRDL
jgi:plasmid stabilization system protein ParE